MTAPVFDLWKAAHRADPHALWNAVLDSLGLTATARTWPRLELVCEESEHSWTPDFFLRGRAAPPVRVPMA